MLREDRGHRGSRPMRDLNVELSSIQRLILPPGQLMKIAYGGMDRIVWNPQDNHHHVIMGDSIRWPPSVIDRLLTIGLGDEGKYVRFAYIDGSRHAEFIGTYEWCVEALNLFIY